MFTIQFQRAAFWWCQVGAITLSNSIIYLLAAMSHFEASIVVKQLTLMSEGRFSTWLTIQYVGNESQMC
jgi:hypothetical protein